MSTFEFGHARRQITPTVPVNLAGYFNLRMWTGVLDDIHVDALALRCGDDTAALLQFDLVTVPDEIIADVRDACAEVAELNPANLLFTGSHTHTAPDVRVNKRGFNPEYNRFLVAQTVECVRAAVKALRPGELLLGEAHDDRFAFNRRYWMKSGAVVTNPPRQDPEIQGPEGPIDPDIPLLGFRHDGNLNVLLANVTNHADTTEGSLVSGDWPGHLRRRLEAQITPACAVIPINGAEGNINHFDPNGPPEQSGPEVARRIGEGYAESVLAALDGLQPCPVSSLRCASATFRTGPREIEPEDLQMAREDAAKYEFDGQQTLTSEDLATKSPAALKYFADSLLKIAEDRRDRRFEVRALALGNAVIVNIPGEPFVEIGLQIRKEFCRGRTALVAALNQNCGYIPNRFNHGRGGYETTPRCSPYSIETGNHLLEATRKLLAKLLQED